MTDILYGFHPVREGLRGRRQPLELFVTDGTVNDRVQKLLDLAAERSVPVRRRQKTDLDRLAGHPHHQGVVLSIEPFTYCDLEDLLAAWRNSGRPAFLLLLDGITDPHNFGAILRNADAAGCHGVVVPKDRSCPVSGVVDKTSAGAVEHLPICQVTNLGRTIEQLKAAGIWIYGLSGDDDVKPLYAEALTGDVALVIGAEGEGLRKLTRQLCDGLLSIPMGGQVASLNAASASAVALFEVVRQRKMRNEIAR
ncbi:MAG: 23S rRNA (guanosine(2251)-2'-O)-methyltransferase RlmB [Desulfuromonadales bacterium]|nr:23S rRNA (guanosine(2251)-2'-O)-methyltransferase RlmB [Desulfuromonadales bacterium]